MNLFRLSIAYIRQQKLRTLLNVLLLSLGIGTIVILLLFSYQFEENLAKNSAGIDAIVGAKGSPVQLILSSIFHMDAPTGNISLVEAKTILDQPAVSRAIPLALGDNYSGYRIVGTTKEYTDHYQTLLQEGRYWSAIYEITIGSDVAEAEQLAIGDEIISSHGLSSGGHEHGENPLTVVGILRKSNTVIDRLILTGVPTIWAVHEHENDEDHEHDGEDATNAQQGEHHAEDHHNHHEPAGESPGYETDFGIAGSGPHFAFMTAENMDKELTSLLITYSSPLAAATFPRFVNAETGLQAAAPGYEIARLLNLLGIGLDALRVFGIILILAAALGVFIALYNAMKERKYDLAIMRTMGGTRFTLMTILLLEGLILSVCGCLVGLLIGHGAVAFLGEAFYQARQFNLTAWVWLPSEAWMFGIAVAIGVISSLIPALQAYRTGISAILSKQKL